MDILKNLKNHKFSLENKIKDLEEDKIEFSKNYNKMRTQNQNLYRLNEKLNNTIKKLNERLKEASNWKQQFQMTMPNMGSNYVSFTMMDMHKTINNQKKSVNNFPQSTVDGLNHSFNNSDGEDPTNLDKEIHQFSQNSSSKDKGSSDRKYIQHKKAKSVHQGIKANKTYHSPELYDPNESPNFVGNKRFSKFNEEIKVTKSQIKNPSDINKYVQRTKKRGHGRRKTQMIGGVSKGNSNFIEPPTMGKVKKRGIKFNSSIIS